MSSPVIPKTVTHKRSTAALLVIAALTVLVAVSAVPRYVSGWPWASPLKVHNQSALQAIREQGITLPGWTTQEKADSKIGGDTWSIQQLAPTDASDRSHPLAFLLLRPQIWEADQPEVEWLDLKGAQRWKTDSLTKLPFEVSANDSAKNSKTVRIKADYFRAWNQDQTFAVLQWYASPVGGSASPSWWFWADQKAQWRHRQRLPWVAVSVWLPIEPLSAIAPHQEAAVALGQLTQAELMQTVFAGALSGPL